MKICPICNTKYSDNYYFCIKDHNKLEKIIDEQEVTITQMSDGSIQYNYKKQFQPKCPTCGSPDVYKISDIDKGIHAFMWGLFSKTARSQFECKNCGYKW